MWSAFSKNDFVYIVEKFEIFIWLSRLSHFCLLAWITVVSLEFPHATTQYRFTAITNMWQDNKTPISQNHDSPLGFYWVGKKNISNNAEMSGCRKTQRPLLKSHNKMTWPSGHVSIVSLWAHGKWVLESWGLT